MLVRTSELVGYTLDLAVAKALKELVWVCTNHTVTEASQGIRRYYVTQINPIHDQYQTSWSPSTNWAYGGPIIEREGIQLHVNEPRTEWLGSCWSWPKQSYGPTPLIAAMRCYVSAELGDIVGIPDELVDQPLYKEDEIYEIEVTNGEKVTFNFAYYQDGVWFKQGDNTEITGSVIVKEYIS